MNHALPDRQVPGEPSPVVDAAAHPATLSYDLRPALMTSLALQECFLANADRGDDAANDELVAEMLRQMRALRASHQGGC